MSFYQSRPITSSTHSAWSHSTEAPHRWGFTTHSVVLVGGDGGELGLGEDEGTKVFGAGHVLGLRVDVHHMEARLVPVHGVEDDLAEEPRRRDARRVRGSSLKDRK